MAAGEVIMGKNPIKEQICQSLAEYQRGRARKASDFLKELKKSRRQGKADQAGGERSERRTDLP